MSPPRLSPRIEVADLEYRQQYSTEDSEKFIETFESLCRIGQWPLRTSIVKKEKQKINEIINLPFSG